MTILPLVVNSTINKHHKNTQIHVICTIKKSVDDH